MNPFVLAAWVVCQSLDIGTTAVALRNPRIAEGNPAMNHRALYAVKVSVNVGGYIWGRKLAKRMPESKGARFAYPAIFATAGCVPGVLNLRTIERAK